MARSEEIVPEAAARKASPSAYQGARPMHWARRAAPKQEQENVDRIPKPIVRVLPKTSKPSKFEKKR